MGDIVVHNEGWLIRVVFDCAGEKVNKLSSAVMEELSSVLEQLERASCEVITFESAKQNIFIAGAAIEELRDITEPYDARCKAEAGHELFGRIAALKPITVALIDGACLGGGCELALACDFRFASDNPKTKIGLPEVQLGIIPGWGGTQRLPALIGLPTALGIILPGASVDAKKAAKIKLVDGVCAHSSFARDSALFVESLRAKRSRRKLLGARRPRGLIKKLLALLLRTTPLRRFIVAKARKQVTKSSKGFYPAPLEVLEVLAQGAGAATAEIEAFARLATSDISKSLINLYFANEAAKKAGGDYSGEIVAPRRAAVVGAGVMGGGIAWLLSYKGLGVRLKDISWEALRAGYAQAASYFAALKKRRRLNSQQIEAAMLRIGGALDYSGFDAVDLVIEAVVEDMKVKKAVLAELEEQVGDTTLICSNTSALSISEMACALQRPQNFCGLHFFNPVNRMPLVEIIRGAQTSDATVARALAAARSWGKTAVVVGDCPGFLVNRILLPYINEAAYLVQEGSAIEQIDRLCLEFGMPMGPLTLADEVGLDVGYKVAKILEEGYGQRMLVCPLLTGIYKESGLLGKKGGAGFYRYGAKRGKKSAEPNGAALLPYLRAHHNGKSDTALMDALLLVMVNEAARCLDEKVVASAAELDLAMIMGTGFPAWRGGLCRWADSIGLPLLLEKLEALYSEQGLRFEPSGYLRRLVTEGRGFYS